MNRKANIERWGGGRRQLSLDNTLSIPLNLNYKGYLVETEWTIAQELMCHLISLGNTSELSATTKDNSQYFNR
jgi:hypothetical protein